MDTQLQIRKCTSEDLAEVYEIEKASFDHPYDPSVFEAYLARSKFTKFDGFLVAYAGRRVAGYIIFEYGEEGLIVSMAVEPGSRRRGVATAMLKEALDRLEKKCRSVRLQVAVRNEGAQDLYRAFGFKTIGRLSCYYPNGEDAYTMVKSFRV